MKSGVITIPLMDVSGRLAPASESGGLCAITASRASLLRSWDDYLVHKADNTLEGLLGTCPAPTGILLIKYFTPGKEVFVFVFVLRFYIYNF